MVGAFWPCGCCDSEGCLPRAGCNIGIPPDPDGYYSEFYPDANIYSIGSGVTSSNINDAVFGDGSDERLRILFTGVRSPACDDPYIPSFTTEISQFVTEGGIVVVSVGPRHTDTCWTLDDVNECSQFMDDIGSTMSFVDMDKTTGCGGTTDIQDHEFTDGCTSLGGAYAAAVDLGGGNALVISTPALGSVAVMASEWIGCGAVVAIGFGTFWGCGLGFNDNQTFLNNLCDYSPILHGLELMASIEHTQELSTARKIRSFAASTAAFVADAMRTVDENTYRARLEICGACEHLRDKTCQLCGCNVTLKAKGRAWDCPAGKWPKIQ